MQIPLVSDITRSLIPPSGFCGTTVLVLGDLMMDKYIYGDVHRISPEAPVPVLSVSGERNVAGGAANVALNAAGLHAKVIIAGVIGWDSTGEELLKLISTAGVCHDAVVYDRARPTTCKTRVVCGNHQIVRLDDEVSEGICVATASELLAKVNALLERVDAVILSDYSKGVLARDLPQTVIRECSLRKIPVLVDPKRRDYTVYQRATCITPNLKEFHDALEFVGIEDKLIHSSAPKLRQHVKADFLLVTQGAEGMTLASDTSIVHLPAMAEEVFDVSGAGDTVIATFGTALASGLPAESAVELANAAASVVVRHSGTAPIQWVELYELIHNKNRKAEPTQSRLTRVPSAKVTAAAR